MEDGNLCLLRFTFHNVGFGQVEMRMDGQPNGRDREKV